MYAIPMPLAMQTSIAAVLNHLLNVFYIFLRYYIDLRNPKRRQSGACCLENSDYVISTNYFKQMHHVSNVLKIILPSSAAQYRSSCNWCFGQYTCPILPSCFLSTWRGEKEKLSIQSVANCAVFCVTFSDERHKRNLLARRYHVIYNGQNDILEIAILRERSFLWMDFSFFFLKQKKKKKKKQKKSIAEIER